MNDISITFSKLAGTAISNLLFELCTLCILEGEYPDALNIAQTFPVHETG